MKQGLPLIYTGRQLSVNVSHVLVGPIYGLLDGWAILSIESEQITAANVRIAELEATLKEIAKGNIVYPDLFAQQSLKDTKNSGCPYGVQPSKRCCKVCNELENILFKCNQEIVKQACKTEQLQQQLVAANQRAEQAEAKLEVQTETALQEKEKREQAEAQCAELKQANSSLASAAIEQPPYKNDLLAQNKRMQTAINRYVIGNIELLDAMKAALEDKP